MTHQPDISDDAVLKATGRSWSEWLALLGGADMAQRTREEIIVFLREDHGVPAWWQQAIVNAFEQSIGRSSDAETDDGFEMTFSRTIDLPAETVFQAWIDSELRGRWLRHADFEPSTVRPPGTVRGKWIPDGSWIDVEVAAVGEAQSAVTIGHRKLASAVLVERMREFWKQSLERLIARVGSPR